MASDRQHHTFTRLIIILATVFLTAFVGSMGWSFKTIFDDRERDIDDIKRRIERVENRLYELSAYVPRAPVYEIDDSDTDSWRVIP